MGRSVSSPKRQEGGVVSSEMLLAHDIWRDFATSAAELALGETRRALDQLMLSFGAPQDVVVSSTELRECQSSTPWWPARTRVA